MPRPPSKFVSFLALPLLFGTLVPPMVRTGALMQRGVPVLATVTALHRAYGKCGTNCFVADYVFTAGGVTLDDHHGVPQAIYDRLAVGSTLDVLYDPRVAGRSEPRASIPAERRDAEFRIGLLLLLASVVCVAFARNRLARRVAA